ncbi:MAG: glutaminyl-peptide cyclotransferase [Chloroflexi bacterium]|nr:glutaminyl-peptide cyclotransferase [Chloroflexota bacterium]
MSRQFKVFLIGLLLLAGAALVCSCSGAPQATPSLTPAPTPAATFYYTYEVVNSYPHDPEAFTQGLVYEDGVLYEGTGLYGRSSLRKVELETGEVLQKLDLAAQYFGEGIAIWGDEIVQLTWQSHVGFVYSKDGFELLREFSYPTEGWGITHDGKRLIVSDGTSTLHFLEPETFVETGSVQVFDGSGPVVRLNELEYINGEIYANIWQTNRIVRIDPDTGRVIGSIDLTGLLNAADLSQPVDVLNGIAYDDENDRLFVTGKLWPRLFEIELVPKSF